MSKNHCKVLSDSKILKKQQYFFFLFLHFLSTVGTLDRICIKASVLPQLVDQHIQVPASALVCLYMPKKKENLLITKIVRVLYGISWHCYSCNTCYVLV